MVNEFNLIACESIVFFFTARNTLLFLLKDWCINIIFCDAQLRPYIPLVV